MSDWLSAVFRSQIHSESDPSGVVTHVVVVIVCGVEFVIHNN